MGKHWFRAFGFAGVEVWFFLPPPPPRPRVVVVVTAGEEVGS